MSIEALRAAALASPDDDGPRAVLADALIERGDPEGEFIQVQLALAARPTAAARRRERELIEAHGPRFLEGLPTGHYTFRRGLPYSASLSVQEFVRRSADLRRRGIEALALSGPPTLLDVDALAGIRSLEVHLDEPAALRLVASPAYASLRTLRVSTSGMGNAVQAVVRAIVSAGVVFDELSVECPYVTVPELGSLARLARRELAISRCTLGTEGLDRLLAERLPPSLVLEGTDLGAGGIGRLAAAPAASSLRHLQLDGDIGDAGALFLAESAPLASLEALALTVSTRNGPQNPIGDSGALRLIDRAWPALVELRLGHGAALQHAAWLARGSWSRLEVADLAIETATAAGLRVLAERGTSLRRFLVGCANLPDEAARALADAPWPKLEELSLTAAWRLTPATIAHLRERLGDRVFLSADYRRDTVSI